MPQEILPKLDYSKYLGEWIVVSKSKIIAHDKVLARIHDKIKSSRGPVTIAKIPEEETLIFYVNHL